MERLGEGTLFANLRRLDFTLWKFGTSRTFKLGSDVEKNCFKKPVLKADLKTVAIM